MNKKGKATARKAIIRRAMTLAQAADVLEALAVEGNAAAKHAIAIGVHTYLRQLGFEVTHTLQGTLQSGAA